MEDIRITLRLPVELHERLRVYAALRDMSVNGLIVEILDQSANREEIDKLYKRTLKRS